MRGAAVFMMVGYHVFFDLYLLGFTSWDVTRLFRGVIWIVPVIFLSLVGVSGVLNIQRSAPKTWEQKVNVEKQFIRRGLFIFFLGMMVTLATQLLWPQQAVWFGILHLIGFSLIVLPLFFWLPAWVNAVCAIGVMSFGAWIMSVQFSVPFVFWLGFVPSGYASFDFTPVFPWFAVVLVGIVLGQLQYWRWVSFAWLENFAQFRLIKVWRWSGQYSLWIYLAHQPLLLGVLIGIKYLLR